MPLRTLECACISANDALFLHFQDFLRMFVGSGGISGPLRAAVYKAGTRHKHFTLWLFFRLLFGFQALTIAELFVVLWGKTVGLRHR